MIDSDGYCSLTDLLARDCAHCRKVELPLEFREPERDGRRGAYGFTAQYPSKCGDCGGPIAEGTMITQFGDSRYAHQSCPRGRK